MFWHTGRLGLLQALKFKCSGEGWDRQLRKTLYNFFVFYSRNRVIGVWALFRVAKFCRSLKFRRISGFALVALQNCEIAPNGFIRLSGHKVEKNEAGRGPAPQHQQIQTRQHGRIKWEIKKITNICSEYFVLISETISYLIPLLKRAYNLIIST